LLQLVVRHGLQFLLFLSIEFSLVLADLALEIDDSFLVLFQIAFQPVYVSLQQSNAVLAKPDIFYVELDLRSQFFCQLLKLVLLFGLHY